MATRAKPPAPLVFVASIPPLQSAFTYDGIDGAARIKLDIPAMYAEQIDRLRREFVGRSFRVTIEPDPEQTLGRRRERRDFR